MYYCTYAYIHILSSFGLELDFKNWLNPVEKSIAHYWIFIKEVQKEKKKQREMDGDSRRIVTENKRRRERKGKERQKGREKYRKRREKENVIKKEKMWKRQGERKGKIEKRKRNKEKKKKGEM